ncbi:MAG: dehydrogenase [Porticoccaceae bacterium]|nr:dehydrogenase [Porticoccaceae bacterium]
MSFLFALIVYTTIVSCESSDTAVEKNLSVEQPAALSSLDEMRSRRPSTFSGNGLSDSHRGAELYAQHCASCHEGQVYKAPNAYWLGIMSAKNLYNTMASGIMQQQASALSEQERREIVEHLVQQPFEEAFVEPKYLACKGEAEKFSAFREVERTGWGADTRRFVPKDVAKLDKGDISRLRLKWSFGFPGAMRARSQPTVAMGAIFVGSQDGTVYALDLESGCVRWAYEASAEVRTGVVIANHSVLGELAFFGDLIANVYAVKATTGELVWKVSADNHHSATITGTPAFYDDRLYVPVSSLEVIPAADPKYECCTFRGHVLALDASDGQIAWDSYSVDLESAHVGETSLGTRIMAPSGAPVWTSPTIFASANMLIFGSGENYSSPADGNSDSIIAVRLDTGERIWQRQNVEGDAWNVACMMEDNPNCPKEDGPDHDQASSPLLISTSSGDSILVAGQKDGRVFAIDAETGKRKLWEVDIARGSIQGGVHFGMAADGTKVYAPVNDMNDTRNGEWLDPEKARPGITAIDAETGEVLWSHIQEDVCGEDRPTCDPGISAPVTAIPGAVVAGHLDGFLRIYDNETGSILWERDTARGFDTVNGVDAFGGSMSGAGPTVAQGHLIANSGYGLYFHEPGNALLVYSVDGR